MTYHHTDVMYSQLPIPIKNQHRPQKNQKNLMPIKVHSSNHTSTHTTITEDGIEILSKEVLKSQSVSFVPKLSTSNFDAKGDADPHDKQYPTMVCSWLTTCSS